MIEGRGDALQAVLRYDGHRVTWAANQTHHHLALHTPWVAVRLEFGRSSRPDANLRIGTVNQVPIYIEDPDWEPARAINDFSRAWVARPANVALLERLALAPGDALALGAAWTIAEFAATDSAGDEGRIEALVRIVEAANDRTVPWLRPDRLREEEIPVAFRDLAPLIRRWGIGDDTVRSDRITKARTSTLQALWEAVGPRLQDIDVALDEAGDNSTGMARLGRLAEATAEARIELERRGLTV